MKQLMKSMEANPMRLLAGACSLVLTLCLSQAGVAQQTPTTATAQAAATVQEPVKTVAPVAFLALAPGSAQASSKPTAEEEEETPKPNKPGHEGMKVHGHWKFVVSNPDGSIASTTEFENSLVTGGNGEQVLAQLLAGQLASGGMSVAIGGTGMCASYCFLVPGSSLGAGPTGGYYNNAVQHILCGSSPCFPGLTNIATPGSSASTPTVSGFLTLQGSFTDTSNETITQVSTYFFGCLTSATSTIPNATCANYYTSAATYPPAGVTGQSSIFTAQSLGSSSTITTTPGQLVQVTVTLSFS